MSRLFYNNKSKRNIQYNTSGLETFYSEYEKHYGPGKSYVIKKRVK